MSGTEHHIASFSGEQILDTLRLTLESGGMTEFHRLVGLSSAELVSRTREALRQNDLGLAEAGRLMGTNELTLKSWLDVSKALPEPAQQKLAATCMLLKAAAAPVADEEIASLVGTAVALAKGLLAQQPPVDEDCIGAIAATCGPSGMMAAALYLALRQ